MSALVQDDAAQRGGVAVFDVQQAARDAPSQHALGGAPHGCAGLSGRHYIDVAIAREVLARQPPGDGIRGIGGMQSGPQDRARLAAKLTFQLHLNRGSRSTESTAKVGSSPSMGMR